MRFLLILLFLLMTSAVIGLFFRQKEPQKQSFKIVCTTSIIADAIKRLVPSSCEVISLMGPGVDPHSYRARESDMHLLNNADVIFYHGLHLEGKMEEVFHHLTNKHTYAVTDCLPKNRLRMVGFEGQYDPHVWFDILLWSEVVHYCAECLSAVRPEHRAIYKRNAHQYEDELKELHEFCKTEINIIESDRRIIITAHDAFGYFGERYGVEVLGLQGLSTDADIAVSDIMKLINIIISKQIRVIFAETATTSRGLEAVIRGCAARGWHVSLGEALYTDALGPLNSDAHDFITMVRTNIRSLKKALTHQGL